MPNNVNPSQIVIDQPESSGQIQHGTATEPQQPEFQQLVVPRFGMAKGGSVTETRALLKEGGMMDEGGTVDPISGNEVPTGAMKEEVRDDVPAQLSEGEFVIPADVVRYIGLERLMMMRQAAKEGLKKMEEMGQMSNAEEATMEDDAEFESEIDDILSELDSEKEDEGEEEDEEVKMAEGGAVMPNDVTQQTQAALGQAPTAPAAPMETSEAAPAPMPTQAPQEMPASQLIAEDIKREGYTPEEQAEIDMLLSKVAGSKAVALREKNTILLGVADEPGYLTLKMFSTDTPEDTNAAVASLIQTIQKSRIKGIRGSTKNEDILAEFEALGYTPQVTEVDGTYNYSVDMQPKEEVQ